MSPLGFVGVSALAAAAALAAHRVQDRSIKAAIAYLIDQRQVTDVGLRFWAGSWGYLVLALVLAGAAGWLARGL